MSQIIYTTGYSGKNFEDLKPLVTLLDAVLVDIRFSPDSRRAEWTQGYLKLLLGKRYRHVPALGNRTFNEGKITIQNMNLGVKTVLSFGINCVLMCACEDFRRCHRFVVAQELRRLNIQTEELENWRIAQTGLFPEN